MIFLKKLQCLADLGSRCFNERETGNVRINILINAFRGAFDDRANLGQKHIDNCPLLKVFILVALASLTLFH